MIHVSKILRSIGFDTSSEVAAERYCDELVDGRGRPLYLDKVGSVSGLDADEDSHVWDDRLLDQQYRRFLNGS